MITLKEYMELAQYKITEGYQYQWQCFGPNAYGIDSWQRGDTGYSFGVIFDTVDQTVYSIEIHDYKNNRAYRMINPDYIAAFDEESARRGVDKKVATDEYNYIDLDVDDDFIQKALAIVADEEYDTRVQVELDLDKEDMYKLMQLAHERDVTLNKMVEIILQEVIDKQNTEI